MGSSVDVLSQETAEVVAGRPPHRVVAGAQDRIGLPELLPARNGSHGEIGTDAMQAADRSAARDQEAAVAVSGHPRRAPESFRAGHRERTAAP